MPQLAAGPTPSRTLLEGSRTTAYTPLIVKITSTGLCPLQVLLGCRRDSDTTAHCAGRRNTLGFAEKGSACPGRGRSLELSDKRRTTFARGCTPGPEAERLTEKQAMKALY